MAGGILGAGRNFAGQLGTQAKTNLETSVLDALAPLAGGVVQVAARGEGAIARLANGTARTWGGNGESGAIGNGTLGGEPVSAAVTEATPSGTPAIRYKTKLALAIGTEVVFTTLVGGAPLVQGTTYYIYNRTPTTIEVVPTRVGPLNTATPITLTSPLELGTVIVTKPGAYLKPVDPGLTNLVDVAAAGNHCLACDALGSIYSWGGNLNGTIGDGTSDGPLKEGIYGKEEHRQLTPLKLALGGAVKVFAGVAISGAILADTTCRLWGANLSGEVGDGTTVEKPSPVDPGLTGVVKLALGGAPEENKSHILALHADGTVSGWGKDTHHQILNGKVNSLTPRPIPGLTEIVDIAAQLNGSLALKANGDLLAWGRNLRGSLGLGPEDLDYETPTVVMKDVTSLDANGVAPFVGVNPVSGFVVATDTSGQVWGFGYNARGELGDGTTVPKYVPTLMTGVTGAVATSAGEAFSLVLQEPGEPTDVLGFATVGVAILGYVPPPLPTALTLPPTSVTDIGATLNGEVDPEGVATEAYYEYGLDEEYGTTTSGVSLGSGSVALPVSKAILGLLPGTTYHYQLVASDSRGDVVTGGDQTFTTATVTPPEEGGEETGGGAVEEELGGTLFAAEVYAALGPIAESDAAHGHALRALVRAIGSMFAQAEEAIRALGDGLDSWERLWSPREQPDWMLPFVGQGVGVTVDTSRSPEEQRAQIEEEGGWKRGRLGPIVAAIQSTLTGTKAVKVTERYTGNAWLVLFSTKPEETPNPTLTEAVGIGQKPGGMIFLFALSSLPRIDEATRTINAAEGTIDTATISNVT